MKKSSRNLLFLIICLCLLLICGYFWMNHEKKEAFIQKQEYRIAEFFTYDVPAYKEVKFTGYSTVPTGNLFIDGYINGDKSLNFSAQISLGSGEKNFEGGGIFSTKLDQMFKHDKTVSAIEELKKEQKKKERKMKNAKK